GSRAWLGGRHSASSASAVQVAENAPHFRRERQTRLRATWLPAGRAGLRQPVIAGAELGSAGGTPRQARLLFRSPKMRRIFGEKGRRDFARRGYRPAEPASAKRWLPEPSLARREGPPRQRGSPRACAPPPAAEPPPP